MSEQQGVENPYAGRTLFFGRERELGELVRELTGVDSSLAAVMAGRGMGKTRFAEELERRLAEVESSTVVHRWRRTPANFEEFRLKLGDDLGVELSGRILDEEIFEAIRRGKASRHVFLFDEVDSLAANPAGRDLLDILRVVWQDSGGRLGVVIFGGSSIWDLLESKVSPFLRSARLVRLGGAVARRDPEICM